MAAAGASAFANSNCKSPGFFFLAGAAVAGVIPAVASTFGFSFLGFLASLLDLS